MWNCPKCNEASEDNFDSCWKCGAGRGGEPVSAGMEMESPAPANAQSKTNWPLFFCLLFVPPCVSIVLMSSKIPDVGLVGLGVAVVGSVVAGVGCAGMLSRRLFWPGVTNVVLTVVYFGLFTFLSLTLSVVGTCSLAPKW